MLPITDKRYPFEPLPPADKKQADTNPTEESATSESQGFPFEQLPPEVKIRVLKFLDLPDLGSCCLTSRELNQLVAEKKIWKVIAKRIDCLFSKISKEPFYKQVVDCIGTIQQNVAEFSARPKDITDSLKGPSIDQINAMRNWSRARYDYLKYYRFALDISRDFLRLRLVLPGQVDNLTEQEIIKLCREWREQNDSLLKARDTLIVWQELAGWIRQPSPMDGLFNLEQIINKSGEFNDWFDENKDLLNQTMFRLDLRSKYLTSLPQIGGLTLLADLNLSDNLFTTIPESICQCPNLKSVNLFNNFLTSIPKEIGLLSRLETLLLYCNRISLIPQEIGQLPKLSWLKIHGNPLTSVHESVIQRIQCGELNDSGIPSSLLKRSAKNEKE